jgi:catechol 2,3-dioxygenase-like lactoylglutathione lyase family enzyme/predicted ester cyclase
MKFKGVCLITDDVNGLSNFYRHVLQVSCDRQEDFAALATEGAHLTLYNRREMESMAPGSAGSAGSTEGRRGCTLEFEVADVDQEHQRLVDLGIPIVKAPTTQSWGIRSVWFRDPDGNLVNFFARVGEPDSKAIADRVREYFHRTLNQRDPQVFDEMLSSEYVDHDAPPDTPPGPRESKQFVSRFLDAYPDLQVKVEDVLAAGDRAAVRLVWRGHHRETGKALRQTGLVMLRFNEQGQIAERWSVYQSAFPPTGTSSPG